MSNTKFADEFIKLKPNYEKLGTNVQQALEIFLNEQEISFLSIKYRVKELNSFLKKIEKKGYKKPLDEIEDICGIRIICYFQNDIEKIKEIILKEFDVTESQAKQELLSANEFGYRSSHFIAKIKDSWTSTPNYRGLNNLKFEIQVRTILMHSWAEIEHKLAYKSEIHIPKNLRRKFSLISAVLEDTDSKFEEIKDAIASNKAEIISRAQSENKFDDSLDLNLDTLQAFLDYAFKDRDRNIEDTREILDEILEFNISFQNLIQGYYKYKDTLNKIEMEENELERLYSTSVYNDEYQENDVQLIRWHQSGAVRTLMDLVSISYSNARKDNPYHHLVDEFRNNP